MDFVIKPKAQLANLKLASVLFVLLLLSGQSWGQLLNENFDYTAGTLLTANGWTSHSGTSNFISVSSSTISYPGYQSSGIGNEVTINTTGQDVNKAFSSRNSGSVYASFIIKVDTAKTTGDYFAHFAATSGSSVSTFSSRVWVKKDASTANFAFGFSSKTSTSVNYTGFNYSTGITYLVVIKYAVVSGTANDISALYINPTLNSTEPTPTLSPTTTDNAGIDLAQITSFCLRQGTATAAPYLKLDGIRVDTTWAGVVGSAVASPPTWTFGWPKTEGATTDGFIAKVNINVIGTSYFVVLPSGALAPSALQVKAGQDASGSILPSNLKGTISCLTGATEYTANVGGLSSSTTYNVYFIAEDVASTLQLSPVMTSITTTSAIPVAPTVINPTVSGITSNSAILGGNISSNGNSSIINRGTVFSISPGVTISNNYLTEGDTLNGVFSHLRNALPAKTQIYYKAFATNAIGTTLSTESSFFTLAIKPNTHVSSFTAATIDTSKVNLSWAPTIDADGYLIIRKPGATAPTGLPIDATAYSIGSTIGDGVVATDILSGSATSVQITGLSPLTQYTFIIIPYTFDGVNYQTYSYYTAATIPSANATTEAPPASVYVWNVPGGSGLWTNAANWTPNRFTPVVNDILFFMNGMSDTISGVPAQTVGQIIISNNTTVNLQASAAVGLNIAGYTGTDLSIEAGSSLNISGTSVITLKLLTSATASIFGNMNIYSAAHKVDATNSGAIVFENGSTLTQGTGSSGNLFTTTGTASVVLFKSGSTFAQITGSNPFGLSAPASKVVFEDGSLFKFQLASGSPSLSGRTYANLEFNPTPANTGLSNMTGAGTLSINNLTLNTGNVGINLTGTINIKGNIIVAAGANLTYNPLPAGGHFNLNGNSTQTISGNGTFKTGSKGYLVVNNANGINVNNPILIGDSLTLTNGILNLGSNITFDSTVVVIGNPSTTSMIVPNSYKIFKVIHPINGGGFTFPIGESTPTLSYLPVSLSFNSGTFAANNYVGIKCFNIKNPTDSSTANYLNRYWELEQSGISNFVCNANFQYSISDITGTESSLLCKYFSVIPFIVFDPANVVLHQLNANGITQFGAFGAGEAALASRTLNLKVFLEGLFDPTTEIMRESMDGNLGEPKWGIGIADHITVELHQADAPYNLLETFTGIALHTIGTASLDVSPQYNGSYYLSIKNRNHMNNWSAVPVSFAGSVANYDFTTGALQAFASPGGIEPQFQVALDKFAMYVGDLDQGSWVDATDFNIFEPDLTIGSTGFFDADFDGGGWVDAVDFNLFEPRLTSGIYTQTP